MEKLVVEYMSSDGYMAEPVEYDSIESFKYDFETSLLDAVYSNRRQFKLVGKEWNCDGLYSEIFKNNCSLPEIHLDVSIYKLDEWFETNKNVPI